MYRESDQSWLRRVFKLLVTAPGSDQIPTVVGQNLFCFSCGVTSGNHENNPPYYPPIICALGMRVKGNIAYCGYVFKKFAEISTFFKYPPEIRKIIYTTNIIESY
jgi:hypothetical protein